MGTMAALDAQIDRLTSAHATFAALAPRVDAGRPWPLSDRFGTEPEADWGPQETLAHVAEMLPFWLGEIERIVDAGGPVVPFGRIADDELRIGVIGRDRSLPPRALFDRIEASVALVSRRLALLDASAAAMRGSHPRLGELTVAEIADRFMGNHLADHAAQLDATLASLPASD
jgi:hypothetical protein